MSERVIAIEKIEGRAGEAGISYLYPDPEAPSVAEVVEVLKESRDFGRSRAPVHAVWDRIDNLIARLEG